MTDQFESRVQGIPCKIEITYYDSGYTCKRRGHPDDWNPDEPPYLEYVICDQRGRPAPWLERKALCTDHDRIFQEAMQALRSSE